MNPEDTLQHLHVMRRGLKAALRWLYLDTAEIVRGTAQPPPNSSPEFLRDLADIRAACRVAELDQESSNE